MIRIRYLYLMASLHIALSRVSLQVPIHINSALRLEPTYAHVFAHPMLAVKPPPSEGAHHPAPWSIVQSSGFVETATVQLTVEAEAEADLLKAFLKAQSLISLMRLWIGAPLRAPIYSTSGFAEIANGTVSSPSVFEFEPPLRWPMQDYAITPDVIGEIRDASRRLEKCRANENFSKAFGLLDSVWWIPRLSSQMIAIWSSAETLLQPGRVGMTKELARLVRQALGTNPSEGDRIFNEVTRLCAERGGAAHAGREPAPIDVQDSYIIVRQLMLKALRDV